MKAVLNVRGAHCSGKTTAVRMFLNKHPHFVEEIMVDGRKTPITVLEDKSIIVLGRYDQGECGGCDRYKGGSHVKSAIINVVKKYNPDLIIYEGIMYSVTFKMAKEIAALSAGLGYQWRSVFLFREYEAMLSLLEKRNNGKVVNLKAVSTKWERAMAVFKMLQKNGFVVKFVNVTDLPIDKLSDIIEDEIA